MLLNVLLVDMSSRVGLERGDRDIGDPSDDDAEIDDIPDEATDVFLDDSSGQKRFNNNYYQIRSWKVK